MLIMTDGSYPKDSERLSHIQSAEIARISNGIWGSNAEASDSWPRLVDIHEASGVDISRGSGLRLDQPCLAYYPTLSADISFTQVVFCPPNEIAEAKVISVEKSPLLLEWLQDDRGNKTQPFVPSNMEELVVAEQLEGRLLFLRTFSDTHGALTRHYFLRPNIEFDAGNTIELLDSHPLRGSDESPDLHGNVDYRRDTILAQIYATDKYVVRGQSSERTISLSTLAIIDAAVQLAAITGCNSLPLSVVLAQIYDYESFAYSDKLLEVKTQKSRQDMQYIAVLNDVLQRWTVEMGLPQDAVFDGMDIFDELAIRKLDLKAIAKEYGNTEHVIKKPVTAPNAEINVFAMGGTETRGQLDVLIAAKDEISRRAKNTSADLLAQLSPQDQQNVKDYAELMAHAVRRGIKNGVTSETLLMQLAEESIIDHDVASVHQAEILQLLDKYRVLAEARDTMEEAGIDTDSVDLAFQTQLVDFIVRNADAVRRTQSLAPEVGVNFDALLEIIERTKLKHRSLKEITGILGKVVTAQERVVHAAFPELITQLRNKVMQLEIEFLDPPGSGSDRSGATLFVSTSEAARKVRDYIIDLFQADGMGDKIIPVSITAQPRHFEIHVGDSTLRAAIPKTHWLPKAPDFFTKTRGH
jgi:hypothetical protein